jgi:hypothetical protein
VQRFFFDLRDGTDLIPDVEGRLLADVQGAIAEAMNVLGDTSRVILFDCPETTKAIIAVDIRTGAGSIGTVRLVYHLQMELILQ